MGVFQKTKGHGECRLQQMGRREVQRHEQSRPPSPEDSQPSNFLGQGAQPLPHLGPPWLPLQASQPHPSQRMRGRRRGGGGVAKRGGLQTCLFFLRSVAFWGPNFKRDPVPKALSP